MPYKNIKEHKLCITINVLPIFTILLLLFSYLFMFKIQKNIFGNLFKNIIKNIYFFAHFIELKESVYKHVANKIAQFINMRISDAQYVG